MNYRLPFHINALFNFTSSTSIAQIIPRNVKPICTTLLLAPCWSIWLSHHYN